MTTLTPVISDELMLSTMLAGMALHSTLSSRAGCPVYVVDSVQYSGSGLDHPDLWPDLHVLPYENSLLGLPGYLRRRLRYQRGGA